LESLRARRRQSCAHAPPRPIPDLYDPR
jgi:hypothetical protein